MPDAIKPSFENQNAPTYKIPFLFEKINCKDSMAYSSNENTKSIWDFTP